jgi:hypothetical protein
MQDTALASDVEATTGRLTTKIKTAYPAVKHLFIEVKAGEVKAGEVKAGEVKTGEPAVKTAVAAPPASVAMPISLSAKAAGRPPETKKQKGRKKRR